MLIVFFMKSCRCVQFAHKEFIGQEPTYLICKAKCETQINSSVQVHVEFKLGSYYIFLINVLLFNIL